MSDPTKTLVIYQLMSGQAEEFRELYVKMGFRAEIFDEDVQWDTKACEGLTAFPEQFPE